MISIIFWAWVLIFIAPAQQIYHHYLYSDSIKSMVKGLSGFSVNYMNFSGKQIILTFGGAIGQNSSNLMIQSMPSLNNSHIYSTNSIKPEGRINHCTFVSEYKIYIYGGVGQNELELNDLWQFNTIFLTWSHMTNSSTSVRKCNIIKNNTDIIIAGLSDSNQLKMMRYSLLNNVWENILYFYADYVELEGNLWYQKNQSVFLSVDNLSPKDSANVDTTNLQFNQNLITSQLYILPYRSSPYTSASAIIKPSNYTYLIVTQTKILILDIVTQQIKFIRSLNGQSISNKNILDCEISDKWMLIFKINIQNQIIIMEYYSLNNFYDSGANFYQLPQLFQGNPYGVFKTVNINGDIFIISYFSLESWILYEHCDMSFNITHIEACLYDQIHCQDGFRGPMCNQSVCPNTLYLYDKIKNEQIYYQCSNHGQCVSGQCHCDEYWTGEDCSIYKRKQCNGDLLLNWPIMNCQCKEETSGGNSCQVVFCYNDCSQHGICLSSGKCQCDSGYYGEDCSITIIQFPGLVNTI